MRENPELGGQATEAGLMNIVPSRGAELNNIIIIIVQYGSMVQ